MSDNNTFVNLLSYTADKTIEMAKNSSAIGDAINIDGVTIIPISKVSIGFAGGGTDISDAMKKKSKNPSGAGASITVTPTAFLVINGKKVKTVAVNGKDKSAEVLAGIISGIKSLKEKKK